jgi:hypothetical protein
MSSLSPARTAISSIIGPNSCGAEFIAIFVVGALDIDLIAASHWQGIGKGRRYGLKV